MFSNRSNERTVRLVPIDTEIDLCIEINVSKSDSTTCNYICSKFNILYGIRQSNLLRELLVVSDDPHPKLHLIEVAPICDIKSALKYIHQDSSTISYGRCKPSTYGHTASYLGNEYMMNRLIADATESYISCLQEEYPIMCPLEAFAILKMFLPIEKRISFNLQSIIESRPMLLTDPRLYKLGFVVDTPQELAGLVSETIKAQVSMQKEQQSKLIRCRLAQAQRYHKKAHLMNAPFFATSTPFLCCKMYEIVHVDILALIPTLIVKQIGEPDHCKPDIVVLDGELNLPSFYYLV